MEIEYLAHHGSAGEALVRASDAVDLIVVGSRGSVTDQCLKHAACPVVVVRGEVQADRDEPAGTLPTGQSRPGLLRPGSLRTSIAP